MYRWNSPAAGRCTSIPAIRTWPSRWCASTSGPSRRRRDRGAVRFVRGVGTDQHAELAAAAGDTRLQRRAADVASRTYELSEFLVDVLGVSNVGATSRIASPTTRPVTRCESCAWATARFGCYGRSRGSTWPNYLTLASAAGSAGSRGQEGSGVGRDARRQDRRDTGHRSGFLRGRGRLVPAAHRRRPVPAGAAVRTRHIAEILASTR